jgi:hypothetical protein
MLELLGYKRNSSTGVGEWTKLYSGTKLAVLINFDVLDLEAFTKVGSEYVHEFDLMGTEVNAEFFNDFGDLHLVSPTHTDYKGDVRHDPAIKVYQCQVKNDGAVILDGNIQLINYDSNADIYKVAIFGRLNTLKTALEALKVKDLKWLEKFNHTYSSNQQIIDSWNGQLQFDDGSFNDTFEMFYPLQDNVGYGFYHEEDRVKTDTEEYTPFYGLLNSSSGAHVIMKAIDCYKLPPAMKFIPLIDNMLNERKFVPISSTGELEQMQFSADMDFYKGNKQFDNLFLQLPGSSKTKSTAIPEAEYAKVSKTYDAEFVFGTLPETLMHKIKLDNVSDTTLWSNYNFVAPNDGDFGFASVFGGNYFTDIDTSDLEMFIYLVHETADGTTKTDLASEQIIAGGIYFRVELTAEVTLAEGDKVYLELRNTVTTAPDGMWVTFTIGVNSGITVPSMVIDPNARKMGSYFGDMTQLELLKEFLMITKSVIKYRYKGDALEFMIMPLIDIWKQNATPTLDITPMVDRKSKFNIKPASEYLPKTIDLKWKENLSFLNKNYKEENGVDFGALIKIHTNNRYAKESLEYTGVFEPFITNAIQSINEDVHSLLMPRNFKDIEKFTTINPGYRLFYWDLTLRAIQKDDGTSDSISLATGIENPGANLSVHSYPFCHSKLLEEVNYYKVLGSNDLAPGEKVYEANWALTGGYDLEYKTDPYVMPLPHQIGTFWYAQYKEILDGMYEYDSKVLDIDIHLLPEDYAKLNEFAPVIFDNLKFRILSYSDYDVMDRYPVNFKLIRDQWGASTNLEIPKNLTLTFDSNTRDLVGTWDAVPDATEYTVSLVTDGTVYKTFMVTGTTFTEADVPHKNVDREVYYTLRASTNGGNVSPVANSPVVTIPFSKLSNPTGLTAEYLPETNNTLHGTWHAVPNASAYEIKTYLGDGTYLDTINLAASETEFYYILEQAYPTYYYTLKAIGNDMYQDSDAVTSPQTSEDALDTPIFNRYVWGDVNKLLQIGVDRVDNATDYDFVTYRNGVAIDTRNILDDGTNNPYFNLTVNQESSEQTYYTTVVANDSTGTWDSSQMATSIDVVIPALPAQDVIGIRITEANAAIWELDTPINADTSTITFMLDANLLNEQALIGGDHGNASTVPYFLLLGVGSGDTQITGMEDGSTEMLLDNKICQPVIGQDEYDMPSGYSVNSMVADGLQHTLKTTFDNTDGDLLKYVGNNGGYTGAQLEGVLTGLIIDGDVFDIAGAYDPFTNATEVHSAGGNVLRLTSGTSEWAGPRPALEAPQNLTSAWEDVNDVFTGTWDVVANAENYKIKMFVDGVEDYTATNATPSFTAYVHPTTSDQEVYYEVYAVSSIADDSPVSTSSVYTVPAIPSLSAPTNLVATYDEATDTIHCEWDDVSNADLYTVWVYVDTSTKDISDVTSSTHSFSYAQDGSTHQASFRVVAKDTTGEYQDSPGVLSAEVEIPAEVINPPDHSPTIDQLNSCIKRTTDEFYGAVVAEPDAVQYMFKFQWGTQIQEVTVDAPDIDAVQYMYTEADEIGYLQVKYSNSAGWGSYGPPYQVDDCQE